MFPISENSFPSKLRSIKNLSKFSSLAVAHVNRTKFVCSCTLKKIKVMGRGEVSGSKFLSKVPGPVKLPSSPDQVLLLPNFIFSLLPGPAAMTLADDDSKSTIEFVLKDHWPLMVMVEFKWIVRR